jgi:hypothetical protein
MNIRLFTTSACALALAFSPLAAMAQQTLGPVAGDNAASNSQSGSTSNAQQSLTNGGSSVGPIDSSVRVGPTTSTSDSASQSGSISGSVSQGGNSASDAHATGGTSSATTGASTSSSVANPNANNAGNAQNITFNSTVPQNTKARVETVPTLYAPALSTTLTETCMGSTSGGVSVMGFGGTLGTTWNDSQCVRRLNAREMAQTLGDRAAARALMCQDKDVAAAYAAVGQDCRQKYEVAVVVPPPAPISPVVINVPAPAAAPAPYAMPPVPNPPQVIYRDRPAHRGTHKNVPACKVDPHYACPAHDD